MSDTQARESEQGDSEEIVLQISVCGRISNSKNAGVIASGVYVPGGKITVNLNSSELFWFWVTVEIDIKEVVWEEIVKSLQPGLN